MELLHHAPDAARRPTDLWKRLGTAILVLPPVVFVIWVDGWGAALLFSVAAALATGEFLALGPNGPVRAPLAVFAAALLPWLPLWLDAAAPLAALLILGAVSLFSWSQHLRGQGVKQAAVEAPQAVQALVFCGLGPLAMSALRFRPDGHAWALAVLAATFANDAGAWAFGRLLGRHPMAPRVSPGKSWEGFAFGSITGAAAAAGAALLWPTIVRPLDAVVLALVSAALGPLGDLAKSMLKRARSVKDSGHLLPGHGGMLDRLDALFVTAPALWAWLSWR